MGLKQKRSVEDYGEQFQELSARFHGMDRKALLAGFLMDYQLNCKMM